MRGESHPAIERDRAIGREVRRLSGEADTLNMYARAAAETFEATGRESCLGAQARFETAAIARKDRVHKLRHLEKRSQK